MNSSLGDFKFQEFDEKSYLVCSTIEYSSNAENGFPFICPNARMELLENRYKDKIVKMYSIYPLDIDGSVYFKDVIHEKDYHSEDYYKRLDSDNHPVLPLYWCNNKINKNDADNFNIIGPDYYFCVKCDQVFPKHLVEIQFKIKHPIHPSHPLTFSYSKQISDFPNETKISCFYHCSLCKSKFEGIYAQTLIPFVLDQPKRHDHPLTLFIRNDSLFCNICGFLHKIHLTYVCLECNFVSHEDCAYFPSVIRISRHFHRIYFTSSLPSRVLNCGVCRKHVSSFSGAYTCKTCDDYVVHPRCATRKDIWDGKELEGVPEEDDDIEEIVESPFERMIDGRILHFTHDHCLKLKINGEVYDGNQICQACVLPISDGGFYSCMECDFILHDTCANAPRIIQHPLHPHPLTLKVTSGYNDKGFFKCSACKVRSSGFIYECKINKFCFRLDVRCASIYEPFYHQSHEHPLFMALDPEEKLHSCQICGNRFKILINCIKCNFIRCFECITLPYMVRYKHDKHFLKLDYWEEENEPDWCEVCERRIFLEENNQEKRFYRCEQCRTTLHLKCLLGKELYLKSGHTLKVVEDKEVRILPNNSLSRPICDYCHDRCVDTILFRRSNNTFCSPYHAAKFYL